MNHYRLHEADLEVPDSWQNQTLNIFKLPAAAGAKEASLIISRDPSQGDATFIDYVAAQLRSAEQQLPAFKLIKHWDFTLHDHAASLLDYTWQQEGRLFIKELWTAHSTGRKECRSY